MRWVLWLRCLVVGHDVHSLPVAPPPCYTYCVYCEKVWEHPTE